METQFNVNRRTILIAAGGLVGLLLVCLVAFLITRLLSKPAAAPTPAVAAATLELTNATATPQTFGEQTATATLVFADQTPTFVAQASPSATAVAPATPTPTPSTGSKAPVAPTPVKASGPHTQGIYVTRIRVDPPRPVKGQAPTFYVTFVNTSGAPQQYRWIVQIYDGKTNKRFGETKWLLTTFPVGTKEIAAVNNWAVLGKVGCLPFYAQAEWQDDSGGRNAFTSTNGSVVSLPFTVCP